MFRHFTINYSSLLNQNIIINKYFKICKDVGYYLFFKSLKFSLGFLKYMTAGYRGQLGIHIVTLFRSSHNKYPTITSNT